MGSEKYHQILKEYWGYDNFRELQLPIIESIGSGKDTLGLMPTGGGKSLTFQVPAMAMEGICLVVTPLIALMKDQVANLQKRGIKAHAIHSGLSAKEISIILENSIYGNFKFLYLSPERLATDLFLTKLPLLDISFIAIDEAHCISQWGYDFRPAYLKIAEVRTLIPDKPILALTATATKEVVEDIQVQLQFKEKNLFSKSFRRSNVSYVVRKCDVKEEQILKIITSIDGSGIIYTRNRKKCKELAELLNQNNITANFYHAGLPDLVKDERQKEWMSGKSRVVVATNAFGMGIDKPDVRFVIHADIPESPEAYFQEAGRAGRDEKRAFAILLWSPDDRGKLLRRISSTFPEKEEIKRTYTALANYCQLPVGTGYLYSQDFDLGEFCRHFHFSLLNAHSSLKILELAGYIEYLEDLDMPSKVYFTMERNDLYRFQVANEELDTIIKLLLRRYTGLFTEYVTISEQELAQLSKSTKDVVYKNLVKLAKAGVISYIPRKHATIISYPTSREEERHLILPPEVYQNRKERYESRINAMISYCETDFVCREKLLLDYFGQTTSANCGVCDVCIERKKNHTYSEAIETIEEEIVKLISNDCNTLAELRRHLPYPAEALNKAIKWLIDNDKITENDQEELVIKK